MATERITFARAVADPWSQEERYVVKVGGALVGSVTGRQGIFGYCLNSGALGGRLEWANSWAEKATFDTLDAAKEACKARIRAQLDAQAEARS